jgi:hypothetical protein
MMKKSSKRQCQIAVIVICTIGIAWGYWFITYKTMSHGRAHLTGDEATSHQKQER